MCSNHHDKSRASPRAGGYLNGKTEIVTSAAAPPEGVRPPAITVPTTVALVGIDHIAGLHAGVARVISLSNWRCANLVFDVCWSLWNSWSSQGGNSARTTKERWAVSAISYRRPERAHDRGTSG